MSKRLFDLLLICLTAPAWLPALVTTMIIMVVFEGRPIFYPSYRRVHRDENVRIIKFRTMIRNAAAYYNRDTVPVASQRFLNTPIDSPLYTPVGRLIEKCQFTELPQIFHVISGRMSIVGNRPLPENVIASLREAYPMAEDRFLVRCGLTGLVQLIGREDISDLDRLRLEIQYCAVAQNRYSIRLDFLILLFTVLIHMRLMRPLTVNQAHAMINRFVMRDTKAPAASR